MSSNIKANAKKQRDEALARLVDFHNVWGLGTEDEIDPSMTRMAGEDYANLMEIAFLYENKELEKARDLITSLDTCCRDYITKEIMEKLSIAS